MSAKLPMAVDHVVCAALLLADLPMDTDQRQLAERIYDLAAQLESTYEEQS
jgi:hypothetical protein